MFEKELETAILAAKEAAKIIVSVYNTSFGVEIKEDNSPVTQADKKADYCIREIIKRQFPNHYFLTEESDDDLSRIDKEFIWIVDPVDGTKDFVSKDDQFTTNIALCHKHELVLGLVFIPITNEYFYAIKGQGSYRCKDGVTTKIHVSDKVNNLTCLTSVFHTSSKELDIIEKNKNIISHVEKCGASIKACRIAEGSADITYRMSPYTKEWDTAAGQIIVEEAGGYFAEPDGTKIVYNRKDVYNRHGYICCNSKENAKL